MEKQKELVGKILGIMLMSRDYAHRAHLKTKSYSKHMALNDFYDDESDADFDITEVLDDLAEAAQGKFGLIDIPIIPLKGDVNNPIEGLRTHVQMIDNLYKHCTEDYLGNIVQEAQKLYYQTIYKMEQLS